MSPRENQPEPVLIAPRRLQSIDHTVRNSAETLQGVAEHVRDLPSVMSNLRKVTEDLSSERRLIAGDRVRIDLATTGINRLEVKVDTQHKAIECQVQELRDWIKYAMGAAAAGAAVIGWLIASHKL